MKIRMKRAVLGTFHDMPEGVAIGQVVDIPDAEAKRYIATDLAEPAKGSKTETATASDADVETAALDDEEEPEDGMPKQSHPKQVWIDYAVDQGYDPVEVEAMTKAELIELF